MSSENGFNPFDPTGLLKNMRDSGMDAWSKMMLELVQTDAYAQTMAGLLDAWLSSSAPFKKAMETIMAKSLAGLNLPARTDIISLAERLTNIEMRLDDIEAMVEKLQPAGRPARRKSNGGN